MNEHIDQSNSSVKQVAPAQTAPAAPAPVPAPAPAAEPSVATETGPDGTVTTVKTYHDGTVETKTESPDGSYSTVTQHPDGTVSMGGGFSGNKELGIGASEQMQKQDMHSNQGDMTSDYIGASLIATVLLIVSSIKIFKRIGKSPLWSVLMIIPGLGFFIIMCMLAFSEWKFKR